MTMLTKPSIIVVVIGAVLPSLSASIVEFRLEELNRPSAIREAVTKEGGFLVAGIDPKFTKAYEALASSLPKCSKADADRVDTLDDGTVRTTFAQRSLVGEAMGFMKRGSCSSSVAGHMKELSNVLEIVGNQVAGALTTALSVHHHHVDLPSVTDILDRGREYHLDHLHIYHNILNHSTIEGSFARTLTWHTDQGAFLLLILPPGDQNFHYKDHLERETILMVPDDGEVRILVVMGNTLRSNFFGTTPPVRPLPHSVVLKKHSPEGHRVVVGRMFLLPSDIVDAVSGLTYEAWSKQALIPNPMFDTEEIIAEKRRLGMNCNSSSIECWMRCMENTCSPSQTAICYDSKTHGICPNDGKMHPECGVKCESSSGTTTTPTKPSNSAMTRRAATEAMAAFVALLGLSNI